MAKVHLKITLTPDKVAEIVRDYISNKGSFGEADAYKADLTFYEDGSISLEQDVERYIEEDVIQWETNPEENDVILGQPWTSANDPDHLDSNPL